MNAGIPPLALAAMFTAIGVASYYRGMQKYRNPGIGFYATPGLVGSMLLPGFMSLFSGRSIPADRQEIFTIVTAIALLATIWFAYDGAWNFKQYRRKQAMMRAHGNRLVDEIMRNYK